IAVCEMGNQLTQNYAASSADGTGNPAFVIDSWDRNPSYNWSQSFLIFAGPADYDILKSYDISRLELIPERGPSWLRWLANAIAWLLKFLHSFIPNYGIVIIIFSILLKIILYPLTHKIMDANLKMQRIQPQVQEIQAKYKNDPKTMQAELSKLYKETGASPLSGCLPLLLQMPIIFALYSVLRYTIDMRNAKFVGWLKDLSEPDPYLILPILMAVFMILQSLMTRPKKAALEKMDEKQQAMQQSTKLMTWVMPVVLFFIFKGLPSGLVLYYTVFNILTVAHQYYLQKHHKTQGT
ncbi:MAG: membrane protein insertase YidC, partial [Candidatus Syntrophosphaera sp.]